MTPTIGHDLNDFELKKEIFFKKDNNLKKNTFKQNHWVICSGTEMEKGKMPFHHCLVHFLVFVAWLASELCNRLFTDFYKDSLKHHFGWLLDWTMSNY